ncbi:S-adenosyl-L-methionine-dependent methyltransferase [Lentinula edodes]|uniref:S-adenosyl-L-methionine-dependent methyltransferase n=1 Tax=Lentinula edodes TaxID=5353 RepID=UPI001E8D9518|nr:S-adenosyl-L-methionine-dependent methyltransferase [Lentinula edodes]KAH7869840.1 S-adenosyl-L-methionine-dependent methyltransferase [Lentinula edodes]
MDTNVDGSSESSQQKSHYILPSDSRETGRLNLQHRLIVKAFDGKLVFAPLTLKSGDRVLESGAGSGIWTLEFWKEYSQKNIHLDIECIDISRDQFPTQVPSSVHFSLRSILDVPLEWSDQFTFVHQRLLVAALPRPLWHKALHQIYRVLKPGGWLELVESHAKIRKFVVGPNSKNLALISDRMFESKDFVGDTEVYLPPVMREMGFVDVRCEGRDVPISNSRSVVDDDGLDRVQIWYDLWKGFKGSILAGGGYGIVSSEEEYESLLLACKDEWNNSTEAYTTYWTIFAKKPE